MPSSHDKSDSTVNDMSDMSVLCAIKEKYAHFNICIQQIRYQNMEIFINEWN